MKDYPVEYIPLHQIDKNPLNPQGRGDEGDIKHLLQSITESGLYYPILVNKLDNGRYSIIEGHRRYAVFETKKDRNPDFAKIPALVINVGTEYQTKIFREINETSKKLTGKQWLEVFALGAKAEDLPTRLAPSITELGKLFETSELLKIVRRSGPSVYGLARRIANRGSYDVGDPGVLRKIVAWLINSSDSVNARVAIDEGNLEKIKTAIAEGRRMNGSTYPDGEIVSAQQRLREVA
jgi:hypothetical protein